MLDMTEPYSNKLFDYGEFTADTFRHTDYSWTSSPVTKPTPIPFPSFSTLVPAVQPKVELGLTGTYITLYGILFLMVYIQLWMIWYYRHKRLSYQTVFLFLSLTWSGLRVTLFAFFFKDTSRVNIFSFVPYWLLFCFPVCLQFIILCLLVLFFAQVVFKARAKYEPNRFKVPLKISMFVAVVVFIGTNIGCAVVSKVYQSRTLPVYMLYIRVAINDGLFLVMAVSLSVCIFKMAKMSTASVVLEAKGTTKCQAISVSVLVTLLYVSRAVYNLIAVCPVSRENKKLPSFGYGWINVTDQADFVKLDEGYAYVSFAIVLFVWELLPMFVVIIFFRVHKPNTTGVSQDLQPIDHNSLPYFFDNPRRYDSDDENDVGNIPSINYTEPDHVPFAINGGFDSPRGGSLSSTPSRPQRLGYGAVMSTDHNYNGSPIMPSPSHRVLDS